MTDHSPCRTPTGTHATSIPMWTFDACHAAILSVLSEGRTEARDLVERAGADRDALGKLAWHVSAVRHEMEVEQVAGAQAVTLRLADPGAGAAG